jgi:outer membrane protein OmpA-like peptidoglycan-associated protein
MFPEARMARTRILLALGLAAPLLATGCALNAPPSPPPPMARPAAFIPLGLGASYLGSDLIGGHKARAAKMKAAKIRPLAASAAAGYMARAERELRAQTAGIGVDVIRLGDNILIRVPAALTFNSASSEIRPQFDGTLTELARTLKQYDQSYVDVFAHTDTTGSEQFNLSLSQKRATAVAAFLGKRGVTRARIASKGLGEAAPLYPLDQTEDQQAANRRVEIRLVPYTG